MIRRGAAGALVVLAASAIAGCGSAKHESGRLAWEGTPHRYHYKTLPRDGVVTGRVRGTSSKPLIVDARKVRLTDANGRAVQPASARFLQGFGHGLYSPTQFGQVQNAFELQRLGVRVELAKGQVLPLTVAWRLGPGASPPVRIDYGSGSLPLPKS